MDTTCIGIHLLMVAHKDLVRLILSNIKTKYARCKRLKPEYDQNLRQIEFTTM